MGRVTTSLARLAVRVAGRCARMSGSVRTAASPRPGPLPTAREERQSRIEARYRVLWRVLADFAPGGWASRDLHALRLLTGNLEPARPLGSRVADRLQQAMSRVFVDVLDRAADVAVVGRELGIDPRSILTLAASIEQLALLFERRRARAGGPPPFDPVAASRAASGILDATRRIREAVRPRLTCNPVAVLMKIASAYPRCRVVFPTQPHHSLRVPVRASDLALTVERVVRAAARERESVRVRVEEDRGGDSRWLVIDWDGAPPAGLDAVHIAEWTRPLRSYGVRPIWREQSRSRTTSLCLRLPSLASAMSRPAGPGHSPSAGSRPTPVLTALD